MPPISALILFRMFSSMLMNRADEPGFETFAPDFNGSSLSQTPSHKQKEVKARAVISARQGLARLRFRASVLTPGKAKSAAPTMPASLPIVAGTILHSALSR